MKRQASKYAICCFPNGGPCFYDGTIRGYDIGISYNCKVCSIRNDGTRGYECHPIHKASLFVNTDGPNSQNNFKVSEYEVFAQQ